MAVPSHKVDVMDGTSVCLRFVCGVLTPCEVGSLGDTWVLEGGALMSRISVL